MRCRLDRNVDNLLSVIQAGDVFVGTRMKLAEEHHFHGIIVESQTAAAQAKRRADIRLGPKAARSAVEDTFTLESAKHEEENEAENRKVSRKMAASAAQTW